MKFIKLLSRHRLGSDCPAEILVNFDSVSYVDKEVFDGDRFYVRYICKTQGVIFSERFEKKEEMDYRFEEISNILGVI